MRQALGGEGGEGTGRRRRVCWGQERGVACKQNEKMGRTSTLSGVLTVGSDSIAETPATIIPRAAASSAACRTIPIPPRVSPQPSRLVPDQPQLKITNLLPRGEGPTRSANTGAWKACRRGGSQGETAAGAVRRGWKRGKDHSPWTLLEKASRAGRFRNESEGSRGCFNSTAPRAACRLGKVARSSSRGSRRQQLGRACGDCEHQEQRFQEMAWPGWLAWIPGLDAGTDDQVCPPSGALSAEPSLLFAPVLCWRCVGTCGSLPRAGAGRAQIGVGRRRLGWALATPLVSPCR